MASQSDLVEGLEWVTLFGSTDIDYPFALSAGSDGYAYATGSTYGTWGGQTNAGSKDAFVSKISPSGSVVWTRLIGASSADESYAVTVAGDGSIYIAGKVGWDSKGIDGQTHSSIGLDDGFLTKFSTNGEKQWTRLIGTSEVDRANSIAATTDGSILVVGETNDKLFGQTPAGTKVAFSYPKDAFVVKYSASGSVVWAKLIGDTKDEVGYGVTSFKDGSIYVTGTIS